MLRILLCTLVCILLCVLLCTLLRVLLLCILLCIPLCILFCTLLGILLCVQLLRLLLCILFCFLLPALLSAPKTAPRMSLNLWQFFLFKESIGKVSTLAQKSILKPLGELLEQSWQPGGLLEASWEAPRGNPEPKPIISNRQKQC